LGGNREEHVNTLLLAFLFAVAPMHGVLANDIDQRVINHPMFDDRMEDVPITIRSGATPYGWFESEKVVGQVKESVDGRIIGRRLFPSNFTNQKITWWYYVGFTIRGENNYYWLRDTDFVFQETTVVPGMYAFTFIPENDVFPSLGQENIRVLIRTHEPAGYRFVSVRSKRMRSAFMVPHSLEKHILRIPGIHIPEHPDSSSNDSLEAHPVRLRTQSVRGCPQCSGTETGA
jgi:hypothetical protein